MQDQLAEILFYIKGTLKYKWVIIITAWLICIAGWSFISNMPDKYESEAKVNVDSRTMLRPLLRGMAMQANTRGLVQVMQQLMFTRPNLEKIAQLGGVGIESKSETEKQEVIAQLKAGIKINGGKNDIFTIVYESTDAQKSQDIVHAVLTVFSEQAQQRGTTDTGSAQQFIEEQIQEYETRLKNAEKARENFKRINSGLLPEEGGGEVSELAAIKTQIAATQMALGEADSRWKVLKRQMSEVIETDEDWGVADVVMGQLTPEDGKISELKARMNELLLKYTEKHPDVLSLKATIQDLQESREEYLAHMPKTNIISSGAMANPYIQTLKIALNNAEAERASVRSRLALLTTRLHEIQRGMDARLSIETEMQNLDRDYSIVKSNYMKLIESREQAAMTEKADISQGVLRFKIVDAPRKPLSPSSPKREFFNSIVFVAGAGVGIVLAFLLYFIRPTFMSTRQVRMVTGLPVLGSISVQVQDGEKSNKINVISFWFLVAGLFIAYLLVLSNL